MSTYTDAHMKYTITLLVIIAVGVGWWLVSPLFIDKTVNEENPFETGQEDVVIPTEPEEVSAPPSFDTMLEETRPSTCLLYTSDAADE